MTCRNTVSLGAYLLGALEVGERAEFADHLGTCETCKAELLRLSPLPGLLQRLTPQEYEAIEDWDDVEPVVVAEPAPEALPPVPEPALAPATTRPPRRQRILAAAAALAVLLLAVGGWFVLQKPPADGVTAPVEWTATDNDTGVRAQVALTKRSWGTEVHLSMQEVPRGHKLCHMVVYGRNGTIEIAGKWTAGYYNSITEIPGSTSVKLGDIDRIEVIAGNGVLVGVHSP